MNANIKMIDEDCKTHNISFYDLDEDGLCILIDGNKDDTMLFANAEEVKKLANLLNKYANK